MLPDKSRITFNLNAGLIFENMDKELTVPKWMLINRPKIPQMPKEISAQFVCPNPKCWDFALLKSRTATGMDGTLPHCNFENPKPVEIPKNCYNII